MVRDGVQPVGGYIKKLRCKLQLCSGAGVSLPVRSALSSGQEAPTVSAVSLTANEFPGGGVLVVVVSECVMSVRTRGVATAAWKKGVGENRKRKQPPGCSGNLHTPGFGTTQQEEQLSQQLRLFLPAVLCQAGLCPPCFSLKPHGGLQTKAGVTQIKWSAVVPAVPGANVSFSGTQLVCVLVDVI